MADNDHGVRRTVLALTLIATAVLVCGFLADSVWLLGIGVWMVIVAFLIEMIYRPGRPSGGG
jgi:fatty acid desaturase